ncbi:reverse transcriptase domain-containing protein [Tanacetum coccineum]
MYKKSDFQWTPEAEEAFKQMKKLIAELPTLTAPREHEELIIYLAAAKEAISAVLMTDREGRQIPVYFVSRTLRGPEVNYTPMKKLVLALLSASKRLKRYFQAHTIVVVTGYQWFGRRVVAYRRRRNFEFKHSANQTRYGIGIGFQFHQNPEDSANQTGPKYRYAIQY